MSYFALIFDTEFASGDDYVWLIANSVDQAALEAATQWSPANGHVISTPPLPSATIPRNSVQIKQIEVHNLKNARTLKTDRAHICSVTPQSPGSSGAVS